MTKTVALALHLVALVSKHFLVNNIYYTVFTETTQNLMANFTVFDVVGKRILGARRVEHLTKEERAFYKC